MCFCDSFMCKKEKMPPVNRHQVSAKGKNPHIFTCSFHLKREIERGSSATYEKIALNLAGNFTLPFKSTLTRYNAYEQRRRDRSAQETERSGYYRRIKGGRLRRPAHYRPYLRPRLYPRTTASADARSFSVAASKVTRNHHLVIARDARPRR